MKAKSECKVQKAKRRKIASGFALAMMWGYVVGKDGGVSP